MLHFPAKPAIGRSVSRQPWQLESLCRTSHIHGLGSRSSAATVIRTSIGVSSHPIAGAATTQPDGRTRPSTITIGRNLYWPEHIQRSTAENAIRRWRISSRTQDSVTFNLRTAHPAIRIRTRARFVSPVRPATRLSAGKRRRPQLHSITRPPIIPSWGSMRAWPAKPVTGPAISKLQSLMADAPIATAMTRTGGNSPGARMAESAQPVTIRKVSNPRPSLPRCTQPRASS